jgi:hypothetical protein
MIGGVQAQRFKGMGEISRRVFLRRGGGCGGGGSCWLDGGGATGAAAAGSGCYHDVAAALVFARIVQDDHG